VADLGSRAADMIDKMAAGLRAGNVHAVKDVVQELRRRGFDPDIHLRAALPLLERTLLTLIRRGTQHHEQTDFPDHNFRTVMHILDTLNPADWPELAQLLDDHKQDIIRDLLLRMREGWTASALIAVHDLQRWGRRWPELAVIEQTAKTDVDRDMAESRDDYTPSTENLLRYLRQDLDGGDYDAALEIIGELAWTDHPSQDLRQLLDQHKPGLMRALLYTMSSNDREGVLYIMPQYLGGFAKFGVQWPEFAIIERSLETMAREQKHNEVTEGSKDGRNRSADVDMIKRRLQSDKDTDVYMALSQMATMSRNDRKATRPKPNLIAELDHRKTAIIKQLLTVFTRDVGLVPELDRILETLNWFGVQWPELETIKTGLKNIRSERQQRQDLHAQGEELDEDYAFGKPAPSEINELFAYLESHEGYYAVLSLYRLADADLDPSYAEDILPYKALIIRGMLEWAKEDPEWPPIVLGAINTLRNVGIDWPELAAISKSALADYNQLDETNPAYAKQDAEQAVRDDVTEDYALGIPADPLINELFYLLEHDEGRDAVGVLYQLADADLDQGYAEDLEHFKPLIIRGMLEWARDEEEWAPTVLGAIDTLRNVGIDWPELAAISKSALSDYNQLTETIPVYAKQDAERAVRGVSSNLEKMRKAGLSWEAYYQLIDALYGVLAVNRSYTDLTTPVLEHYKTDILRTLLWSIKTSVERGRHDLFMDSMFDAFARARINWPEIDAIKRSMRARLGEAWSKKYKKSIDCSHPKGFSQKAHCAARRKRRAGGKTKSKSVSEAIRGQQRWIQRVADALKHDLERGDWISANYTVQGLNQTDPKEVQEIFEPLAPLLARMAEADPVGNLRQMSRIMGYIDHAYPEVTAVYDKHKTEIMRYLLGEMREPDREDTVRWMIHELRNCGVDWPELEIVTRSLLESAVRHFSKREVHPEGYDQIVNVFRRKLEDGGSRGIFFVMFWAEQWGIDMREWPELDEMVQDHKDLIVKDLLTGIMERGAEGWSYAADMLDRLRNIGIDWPEMAVIQRSLDAERKINESRLSDASEAEKIRAVTSNAEWLMSISNPSLAVQLAAVKADGDAIRFIRDPYPQLWADPQAKTSIIRNILQLIKHGATEKAGHLCFRLERLGCPWPEVAAITQSLEADRDLVMEEFGTFEETMEQIASHMGDIANHLEEGHDLWLVGDLSDIYITLENENLHQQYWPKPEDWDINLEANKTHFVKGILEAIKLGEDDEAVQAVHMLRDYWHVNWPELDIILKSANAHRAQEIDELRGYRSDPVYAASQKELAPSKMKTASERETAMEKFTDYMETQGFKHIGHGSFSSVYLKDGYPWMFKLWSHDPAYLWWITWAAKHQDNPNVPRVKGLPVQIAPDTYVVRLEKLRARSSYDHKQLADLLDNVENVDDISKEDLQWIRGEYPGIYDALRVIQRAGSSFVVDLHSDNIMMRGQTPVLVDPVVG
jgi:hypothetical protein